MIKWIITYDWATSETMPSDRPTIEQLVDDKKFDNWIEDYERKMAQKTATYTRKK